MDAECDIASCGPESEAEEGRQAEEDFGDDWAGAGLEHPHNGSASLACLGGPCQCLPPSCGSRRLASMAGGVTLHYDVKLMVWFSGSWVLCLDYSGSRCQNPSTLLGRCADNLGE